MSDHTIYDTCARISAELFDNWPDGVFMYSGDGVIVSCNAALAALTGYSSSELVSRRVDAVFPDRLAERLFAPGAPTVARVETVCAARDGSGHRVELTVARSGGPDNGCGIAFVRDITRERTLTDELAAANDRLRHAQTLETIGQLAGGVSHYLNNVFTGILGGLNLLECDVPPSLAPLVRKTSGAADRARGVARQMLSLSRQSPLAPQPVDLRDIVGDAASFARLAFDRRITVTVDLSDDLPGVLGDPAAIHHILLNLCVNARDAIETGALSPGSAGHCIAIGARKVVLKAGDARGNPDARPGTFVRVTVADSGCGMSRDVMSRVFEPFFTTKEPGKGTGLGLSTALTTIREFGGWFDVSSEEGRGTSFAFHLPVVTLANKTGVGDNTPVLPPGTETILFVEDEDIVRTFAVMALERLGYTVIAASDGRAALDAYLKDSGGIDLVVLDLGLPVISGMEVLASMRKIDRSVGVVITTGHDFEHDRASFSGLRALDYLMKPFTVADLACAVRNALDRGAGRKTDCG
jgi:PAS domain S-box-containing protein